MDPDDMTEEEIKEFVIIWKIHKNNIYSDKTIKCCYYLEVL